MMYFLNNRLTAKYKDKLNEMGQSYARLVV